MYDEFGVSEDPLQLQAQVRELKAQLENQTKLVLQMQSFLRRSSLSSDAAANTSDLLSSREHQVTQKMSHSPEKSGQLRKKNEAENQPMKDRATRLNLDLDEEKTQNQNTSEQLQQTCSRSTSPARSAFFSVIYENEIVSSEFKQHIF